MTQGSGKKFSIGEEGMLNCISNMRADNGLGGDFKISRLQYIRRCLHPLPWSWTKLDSHLKCEKHIASFL